MSAEVVPMPRRSLGSQLRDLVADPSLGYIAYGDAVVSQEMNGELPIYDSVQEKCATSGVAHVLHYPRHLRRES